MAGRSRKTLVYAIAIIFIIVVFGGILAFNLIRDHFVKQAFAHAKAPPVFISATVAKEQTWHPFIPSVGSIVAVKGVDVTSEASGIVMNIYFHSGEMVKQGEPLVKLDDSVDQQELKNLQAQLKLAQINYQRMTALYAKKATSASTVDETRAKLQEDQALVAKTQEEIKQKTITAPFTGRIGIRKVNLGQYVQPGTQLVSLQAFDPLYIDFSLPEQYLTKLSLGQAVSVKVDAYPNENFVGKITALNSEVSQETRNLLVQATIPNNDGRLYPGLFADVKVILPEQKNVVTVPQTAISYSLYGDSIFVIKTSGKDKQGKPVLTVKRQYVTLGMRRTTDVEVIKGIKKGDQIVTSGQLKLHDGAQVIINNNAEQGPKKDWVDSP